MHEGGPSRVGQKFLQIREESQACKLTPTEHRQVEQTIDAYKSIAENLLSIAEAPTDQARNRVVNEITRGGAEQGFSAGRTPDEALKVLAGRVELFLSTYELAHKKGDDATFFKCFSRGDPCLSGRTESLMRYAASLASLDIASMPDPSKALFLPASAFQEAFFDYAESLNEGAVSIDGFRTFLRAPEKRKEVVAQFDLFSNPDAKGNFKEFLVYKGIVLEGDEVPPFSELVETLLSEGCCDSFELIYKQVLVLSEGLY